MIRKCMIRKSIHNWSYTLLQKIPLHHLLFWSHDLGHVTLVCIFNEWQKKSAFQDILSLKIKCVRLRHRPHFLHLKKVYCFSNCQFYISIMHLRDNFFVTITKKKSHCCFLWLTSKTFNEDVLVEAEANGLKRTCIVNCTLLKQFFQGQISI